MKRKMIAALMMLAAMAGGVSAAKVDVSANISTDEVWTADNTYNLTTQIYVLEGASLTIEAGTLVQSDTSANGSGSLAVCRGAKIFVQGTENNPVIMTSAADNLVSWHEGCNEWGNLTIMGKGIIAYSDPNPVDAEVGPVYFDQDDTIPGTQAKMEGLTASAGDTKILYGGTDNMDDSGSISYLSLRYGGRVVGLANELNGLSLGAIGSETDIDHIDIMNNVDDGIEIWGGAVNLSYVSIWNIGDDSLDADQGWQGSAQFGLIVQGYSTDASQGSGVGDNCFEIDGAENSDADNAPASNVNIANFTVIGQPKAGDGGTTWRDNADIKYHNCVFMNIGEELVRFDNKDGDGAQGYGYEGTKSWAARWADGDCYIKGSVMYDNADDGDDKADSVGVFNAANNNIEATEQPIVMIERAAPVTRGGKTMLQVTYLNPCPKNDALTAGVALAAPLSTAGEGFRGGFAPNHNWLMGWSAAYTYGMTGTANPDLDGDGTVDLADFSKLATSWLD